MMNADISPEPAAVTVIPTRESKSKSPSFGGGKEMIDNSGRKLQSKMSPKRSNTSKSPNRSSTFD